QGNRRTNHRARAHLNLRGSATDSRMQKDLEPCGRNRRAAWAPLGRDRTFIDWNPASRSFVCRSNPGCPGTQAGADARAARKNGCAKISSHSDSERGRKSRQLPCRTQVVEFGRTDFSFREKCAVYRCFWKALESRRNLPW